MLNRELLAVKSSSEPTIATISTGVFKFKPVSTGRLEGPLYYVGANLEGQYYNSNTDVPYNFGVLPNVTLEGRHVKEVGLFVNSNIIFTAQVYIGESTKGDEYYDYCPDKLVLINHTTGNSIELLLCGTGAPSYWFSPDILDETGSGNYPLPIIEDFLNAQEQLWEIVGYYERPTYKVTVGLGDYSGGSDSFEFYGYIEESNAGSISPQYYRGAKITAMTLYANRKPEAAPPGYVPMFYLEFDKYRDPSSDTLYFFTDLNGDEPIELIPNGSNTYTAQTSFGVKEGDVVEFKLGVSPYPDGYTGSY